MVLVGKRYAQALFELSGYEANTAAEELKGFVDIYETDKDFRSFLLDPRIKSDQRQQAVRNIFTGRLSKNILNFILLLIEKNRMKHLHEIYHQFVHLVNQNANVLEMDIISAFPLEREQIKNIEEKFRIKYGASAVKSKEMTDASLIGGVKVIVGDKVYDGSIKGRIESLTELVSSKK